MKKLVLLLLCTPLCIAQSATKIVANWTPAAPTAQWAACSATLNTNCIAGYQATITAPVAGNTSTIPMCSASVTSNCIVPGQSTSTFTWTPGGTLYYGTWTITLQTVAYGSTAGTALQTCTSGQTSGCVPAPITANVVYAPPTPTTIAPAPGGLVIQFQ